MKKIWPVILLLLLTACASKPEETELHIFAASSMTEALDEFIEAYNAVDPNVTIIPTYDSSGTLLTQIQEGADCDLFISASPKQMDALDETGSLLEGTRVDLLENKVTLAVPQGNPKGVEGFDQLAQLLESGDVLLAVGNSDVPVGQYTQKIFDYYSLDETSLAGALTYGSNVKEVTTQVSEGTVDCGIIYSTDALSAGLTVVDSATEEMCGRVIYPAAILADSKHPEETRVFLDWLRGNSPRDNAVRKMFETAGFSPIR